MLSWPQHLSLSFLDGFLHVIVVPVSLMEATVIIFQSLMSRQLLSHLSVAIQTFVHKMITFLMYYKYRLPVALWNFQKRISSAFQESYCPPIQKFFQSTVNKDLMMPYVFFRKDISSLALVVSLLTQLMKLSQRVVTVVVDVQNATQTV